MEYKDALDNLLEGIKLDYYNWTKPSRVEGNLLKIKLESIDRFNESLNIKVGRKFDKVIEKGRVWGFVAKTDGVHKGIPHKKGDVIKAAGWRAPAKWSRGSIFDTNSNWYSWTGPNYL